MRVARAVDAALGRGRAVTDRSAVDVLLRQEASIDLVIPRGGEGLIRAVQVGECSN